MSEIKCENCTGQCDEVFERISSNYALERDSWDSLILSGGDKLGLVGAFEWSTAALASRVGYLAGELSDIGCTLGKLQIQNRLQGDD